MKLFEIKTDYRIFVDLDGVMADLDKYVVDLTGKTFLQIRHEQGGDGFTYFIKDQRAQGKPVFDQLEKMPDADQLWDYVSQYSPDILTATGHVTSNVSKAEKIRWVYDNLQGFSNIYTTISGSDKHEFAAPNHILIDDREQSVDPWRAAGGIGILHKNAADTIAQLQALGL